ncbi:hypothetical protein CCACVL1_25351 [Corchorus capsularis]|uniref:Uncharacterized protein n=1 Tax=Corchorus capsularis TaxID=210143 RepID=A0A1R3GL26_COCAP|nr:hypothetical protein CCACVL1_25351 [Corchorus capsularis]
MGRTEFCTGDGLKKGAWTAEEDQKLIAYVQKHGEGSWRNVPAGAAIAKYLPKRTDNEIKNYWNAHLKKRLANMGIDPVTHNPLFPDRNSNIVKPPMAHPEKFSQKMKPMHLINSPRRRRQGLARLRLYY